MRKVLFSFCNDALPMRHCHLGCFFQSQFPVTSLQVRSWRLFNFPEQSKQTCLRRFAVCSQVCEFVIKFNRLLTKSSDQPVSKSAEVPYLASKFSGLKGKEEFGSHKTIWRTHPIQWNSVSLTGHLKLTHECSFKARHLGVKNKVIIWF